MRVRQRVALELDLGPSICHDVLCLPRVAQIAEDFRDVFVGFGDTCGVPMATIRVEGGSD